MVIICYRVKATGRYLVRSPHGYIYITATSTEPTVYKSGYHGFAAKIDKIESVYSEVNNGNLEMEDLVDLKWLHPHLIKSIKQQLKKYL